MRAGDVDGLVEVTGLKKKKCCHWPIIRGGSGPSSAIRRAPSALGAQDAWNETMARRVALLGPGARFFRSVSQVGFSQLIGLLPKDDNELLHESVLFVDVSKCQL